MSKPEEKKAQVALAEATYFSESGIRFLASYRCWIVAAAWLVARAGVIAIWGLTPDGVVAGYFQTAGDWLDGFTPYADFKQRRLG
jgi:hypothetical protein